MKAWLGLVVLVGISFAFGSARLSRAEEIPDAAKADDEKLRALKELLEQSVDWYEVLPAANAKAGLRPQVVLTWQNAVRTNTGAAVLAIWTEQGRPEAMATIFENRDGQNQRSIVHEFGSLARSNKIVVRDKTRVHWSPADPGVEFRDLPGAPAPAEDSAARLRQMKSLARKFAARLPAPQYQIKNPEVLRLLPQPLYRYALKDSQAANPKLRDGAMFAFVMGTDPEVVLLLEAVEREGNDVWQYGIARATGFGVEASLGDKVVWSVSSQWEHPDPKNLKQIFRPMPQLP